MRSYDRTMIRRRKESKENGILCALYEKKERRKRWIQEKTGQIPKSQQAQKN